MPTAFAGDSTLRTAIKLHQEGRWTQAEPLYRDILQADPAHTDVLHLSGVLACQMGKAEIAVNLIRQALEREPGRVEFHNSLGNAQRALGDLPAAAASYEHALQLD